MSRSRVAMLGAALHIIAFLLSVAAATPVRAESFDVTAFSAAFAIDATDSVFEDAVRIRWTESPPEGYVFHVRRDGELLSLAASNDSTYYDSSGSPGVEYVYCVEVRVAETDIVVATACDPGARVIFPPREPTATDGSLSRSVVVTWSDQSFVEAGFVVSRREAGGGAFSELARVGTNDERFEDALADSGIVYEYCVAAYDSEDFESEPACDEGMRGFILPPQDLRATDGQFTDRVVLTWADRTEEEAEFRVFRDGALIATLPENATTYEDYGALGVSHDYCVTSVRVITDAPFELESIPACDAGVGGEGTLAAPTNLMATDGELDGQVRITWEDPGETEDGFLVLRDGAEIASLEAGFTEFEDVDATPGQVYEYCVIARSDSGGASVAVCDPGLRAHVVPPIDVAATDGTHESFVEITWNSSSTTLVVFEVLRDGVGVKTLSGGSSSYRDYDVDAGIDHDYCVRGYTALGEVSGSTCDPGSRLIRAPQSVVASDEGYEDRVLVTWEDLSAVETGYEIFRKEAGSPADSTSLAVRPRNRVSYIDETCAPGLDYVYTVHALDLLGVSMGNSDIGRRTLVAPGSVSALDGVFEDRIQITWSDGSNAESGFVIRRDGTIIDSVGADVQTYTDFGITFGIEHNYSVSAFDPYGESERAADRGSTTILAPGSVQASDIYPNQVVVVWTDESEIETAYEVFRDGISIGTTLSNETSFTDAGAIPNTPHSYCVQSSSGAALSGLSCDDGLQPAGSGTARNLDAFLSNPSVAAYGRGVAVYEDVAVVGDPELNPSGSYGIAHVYKRNPATFAWEKVQELLPPTPSGLFGWSVAIDEDWILVGAPSDPEGTNFTWGSVFAYQLSGETWAYRQEFRSSNTSAGKQFGWDLDLDGAIAVVGNSPTAPAGVQDATVFELSGAVWTETASLRSLLGGTVINELGGDVAVDGSRVIVGHRRGAGLTSGSGAAHLFSKDSGSWVLETTLNADDGYSGQRFGWSVDIEEDVALVGSRDSEYGGASGAAYAFRRIEGTWVQEAKLVSSDIAPGQAFGAEVALGEHEALIGSFAGGGDVGAVYAFTHDGDGDWNERYMLRPSSGTPFSWSGASLALDGETALIGAFGELRAYPLDLILRAPVPVVASDDVADGPVQIRWTDRSNKEDGYRIYRNDELIQTLDSDFESFSDFDAEPGSIYTYCVVAYSDQALFGESFPIFDFGRRPPDGNITGRVATRFGAGVDSVTLCLDPLPNSAILFDGAGGWVRVRKAELPPTELTLDFWMRSSDATGQGTPVSYATFAEPSAFTIANSGDLVVDILGQSAGPSGVGGNDGDWHHFAITWASLDGRVQIYKDGDLEFEATGLATGAAIPAGGILAFGQRQRLYGGGFQPEEAFLGQLDEVRIWKRVLDGTEISDRRKRTVLSPEQRNELFSRWAFDQGLGGIVEDLGAGAFYGELQGGAHWSSGAPDLAVCITNDLEGNYALSNLRYANSRPIKVTPVREGHSFEPSFKMITLSTVDPVENEVEFTDITTFSVLGTIHYTGTECFAEGVEIHVDGVLAGFTGADGSYSIPVDPGPHVIEPKLGDHVFDPPRYTLNVDRTLTGKDFEDDTRYQLLGRVGGSCDLPIGTLQLAVQNECLGEVTLETFRDYNVGLPPGSYFVRVVDVIDPPEALDRADILAYFEAIGPKEIDLTIGDVRNDFTYHAPLAVSIEGMPEIVCPTIIDPDRNVVMPGVPILPQFESANLTVRVFEEYGNGNRCPAGTAKVSVFDEVLDQENQAVVLDLVDGMAAYKTTANTPNIFAGRVDAQGNDRSYQKPITFVIEVEGREALTHTEWFLVTGDRPRTGTFVSAVSQEIPLMILRDPPGDGSFSSLERGRTTSFSFANIFTESVGLGIKHSVNAGLRMEKGGLFWSSEFDADLSSTFGVEFGVESVQNDRFESTISTVETISTSSDELFVGPGADLFLGVALNLLFAKSDVITIDPGTCILSRSDTVRVGGDQDRFATTYLYTQDHIQNVVIPQLQDLAVLEPQRANYYNDAVSNWKAQLALSASLRDRALASPGGPFPFGYWPPKENRSFSAGADREHTFTLGSTDELTWSIKAYAETENSVLFGFEETGSGTSSSFEIKVGFDYQHEVVEATETSFAVGYTLSDNDTGDYFSTEVAYDPTYATPVFQPRSGRSSCPWEPGTQPRDSTLIAIEPPVLHDVDPDRPGVFTVSLTNASPSEETREYILMPIQTTNPGGAILRANGESFSGGLPFIIGPDQTQEVTFTVDRGPTRYFYEDIQLQLVSPCEYERWQNGGPLLLADSVSFSIDFAAPCSDITLFEPRSGWTFNAEDSATAGDTVWVTLDDFALELSEEDQIQRVGAQFRRLDTDVWFPVGEVEKDSIPTFPNGDPKSVEIPWNVSGLNDAEYELRAYTECEVGKAFSLNSTGAIDRRAPEPFGAPEPADTVLAFGDEISITFDEEILCTSVNELNVELEYSDSDSTTTPVLIDLGCDGRSIIITPLAPPLATLEGKRMTAHVRGIRDLAGNRMESSSGGETESWSFEVLQSAVAWGDSDVLYRGAYRAPGGFQSNLVNGLGQDVDFTLTDVPAWLTPTIVSGQILATDTLPIDFAIDEALASGTHEATLNAVMVDPPAVVPLHVRIELDCRPPSWTVDAGGFENSMTLVVQASVEGTLSQDPDDQIVAYVGTEVRGVAQPTYVAELDDWITFLTVYSNRVAGENVRFRVFDASECRVHGATDKSFRFEADSRVGEPIAPKVLIALDELPMSDQVVDLDEGWTWFSVNLRSTDMSLLSLLGDLNPQPGDVIKSQTAFSQFDADLGWVGSLDQLNTLESYIIHLSEAGTMIVEGDPVVPGESPIPVADGWNWVGYLPQDELDVSSALVGLVPSVGDAMLMRGQNGFVQYVEDVAAWSGNLEDLRPGSGYRLYLDNAFASNNQLVYPDPGLLAFDGGLAVDGAGGVGVNVAGAGDRYASGSPGHETGPASAGTAALTRSVSDYTSTPLPTGETWSFDPRRYEHSMTVTGSLEIDGVAFRGDHLVGAFVDGEMRGLTQLQHVPGFEHKLFFLVVHSNSLEGEIVRFRVFDPDRDRVYDADEAIEYTADGVHGRVGAPVIVATSKDDAFGLPLAFSLVPEFANPLRSLGPVSFQFALPAPDRVVLKVYDVQGREVLTLLDEALPAGRHEAVLRPNELGNGVYLYRMQAGGYEHKSKLVIMR